MAWPNNIQAQPNALLSGMSPEDYYNAPAKPALSGIGTPQPVKFQTNVADPFKPLGLGASGLSPTIQQQLSGYGLTEIPSWMTNLKNVDQTDLAQSINNALNIDPAAWLSSDGKMRQAMHNAGIYKFDNGQGYSLFGEAIPWNDDIKAAVQQAYINRVAKPNTGGFGLSEALGLGVVAAPIMGALALPSLVGGGVAAAVPGAAAPSGVAGLSGPELVAALGGGSGVLPAGGAAASGVAGLSGPELVAALGGGSGIPTGVTNMGFLDTIGNALSGGWGNLAQGALGGLGSWLGGQEQAEAADKSADILWQMFNSNRADMAPLLSLLGNYTGQFADLASGKTQIDWQNDPMYQADKSEMLRTLRRGQASIGKLKSSDTDNAIVRNLSTLQNNAYARKYGGLLDLLKLGSGAASSAGAYGANTGNALAGVYGTAGNNQANMYGGMFASGMGALNNWQLLNMLSNMRKQ